MKRIFGIAAFFVAGYLLLQRFGYDVTVGSLNLKREDFERFQKSGNRASMIVLGACVVEKDVPPPIVDQAVESVLVIGGMIADEEIFKVLGGRLLIVGAGTTRSG